jgi:phage-related protein
MNEEIGDFTEKDVDDIGSSKRQKKVDYVPSNYELNLNVRVGTNIVQQKFDYTANVIVGTLQNITSFDVYINNDFYGTNITNIQININDTLKFEVTKDDTSLISTIELKSELL